MITRAPRAPMQTYKSPRALVLLNGTAVPVYSVQVVQNDFTQADTFTIYTRFSFRDKADDPWLSNSPAQASELLQQDTIQVEVYTGYPKNPSRFTTQDLKRILYGRLDTAEFTGDSEGEILCLTGRNMVGPMIDNQIQYMQVRNMTGSQVAQQFAAEYGLKAQVTPTTTLAGVYFAQENIDLTTNVSQWDILIKLASYDQFICRVYDDTLYYGPSSLIVALIGSKPFVYTWGWNIQSFDLTRSPSAVQDITVTVKSYDIAYKKTVEGVAKSHAPKVKSASTGSYQETLIWPGLTQQQAQAKAEELLQQLSRNQIQGSIVVEGDPNLQVDGRAQLYGFGSGLDLEYYIQKVEHNYSVPQLGQTAQSGNSTTDGYLCTVYVSSSLILDETQVSNPLGLGVPISGSPSNASDGIPGAGSSSSTAEGVTYPPPGWSGMSQTTINQVRSWLSQAFQLTGVSASVWGPGMMWLIEKESAGVPTATNPILVEGQHATGLCQTLPSTFDAFALPGHTNIYNPVDNICAAIHYIQARYGDVNKIPNIGTSAYGGY